MELKYFRLIKTIAEEGSIANSSERLFLTQSALSHQLRELEERLGFKVFIRKRNKWALTQEGSALYKLANDLFATIDEGFAYIQHIKEGSRGKIKLCAECQSFFHGIPAFIQRMGLIYPEIEIDLSLGATHQTISQVLANEIDIALVTSNPTVEVLKGIRVCEDEIFALMHREHPLFEKPYLDAGHFADAHLIINSFPLEGVAVYEHFLRVNKITPARISAIPFTEITLAMIAANMGIMCVPKWQMECFKLPEEVGFKRIMRDGLKRIHYLVVKRESLEKKYISDFIANFEEAFSDQ